MVIGSNRNGFLIDLQGKNMKYLVQMDISKSSTVILELDDDNSPQTTLASFLKKLPFHSTTKCLG